MKKRLDQKEKVNFKIYDVAAWLKSYYSTYISPDLTKLR